MKKDIKIQSKNDYKKEFLNNRIFESKNKSRAIWKIIRSEINGLPKKCDNIIVIHENNIISDPIGVGNMFSDFLREVFFLLAFYDL